MKKEKICKALVKESFALGAPVLLVLACYLIPIIIFVIAPTLWIFLVFGILLHVFFTIKYRRDQYYVKDFVRSLFEKDYLDP